VSEEPLADQIREMLAHLIGLARRASFLEPAAMEGGSSSWLSHPISHLDGNQFGRYTSSCMARPALLHTSPALMAVILSLLCVELQAQTDAETAHLESELFARLRWELLWQEAALDSENPSPGPAAAAIWADSTTLAYCSADLGKCAHYERLGRTLGQRLRVVPAPGKDNWTSLQQFVPAIAPPSTTPNRDKPAFGDRFTGRFAQNSGIVWFAARVVGTRTQILAAYRKQKPPRLQEVVAHLRGTALPSVYQSMTLACFRPEDEAVFVHGIRRTLGEVVFSLSWNEETGWRTVGMVEMTRSPETTIRLREIVRSIRCAEIRF
jgi:hypothetical protein